MTIINNNNLYPSISSESHTIEIAETGPLLNESVPCCFSAHNSFLNFYYDNYSVIQNTKIVVSAVLLSGLVIIPSVSTWVVTQDLKATMLVAISSAASIGTCIKCIHSCRKS